MWLGVRVTGKTPVYSGVLSPALSNERVKERTVFLVVSSRSSVLKTELSSKEKVMNAYMTLIIGR